jgi:hypothetical protein
MPSARTSSPRDQRGGVLLMALAATAVFSILGLVAARQLLPQKRAARRAYHRAVQRNLAEGAITAAVVAMRRGARPPGRVLEGERFGRLRAETTLGVASLGPRRRQLTAEARLVGPGAPPAIVIRVDLVSRPAQGWQIVRWRELPLPR